MTRRGVVVVLVGGVGLLVGLGIAWAGTQQVQGRSWIDAPLDPAVLTLGQTLTVTAHSTDPDGVERMMLFVDGEVVDEQAVGGETLESTRLTWTPTEPGTYALSVFGANAAAEMSAIPGTSTVQVAGRTPTTTTTVPSPTTTVPSPTTTVACNPMVLTAPPLLTPAHNAVIGTEDSVHFSWGVPGCSTFDRFELVVGSDGTFGTPVFGPFEVPTTSVTASDLAPACDLHWRVRAWRNDTPGPWSATRIFDKAGECT